MMLRKVLIAILAAIVAGCGSTPNLHRVDERVWRSGQPERRHFRDLEKQGIGEVLCLRRWHSDREEAPGLQLHHVRMRAGKVENEEIVAALRVLVTAEKPVLVHCFHGSDRTGVVIAMYRMVVQGWPREKAIGEFMEPGYGHHADVFPNIRHYLETVDIEEIRRQVFTSPSPRLDTRGGP